MDISELQKLYHFCVTNAACGNKQNKQDKDEKLFPVEPQWQEWRIWFDAVEKYCCMQSTTTHLITLYCGAQYHFRQYAQFVRVKVPRENNDAIFKTIESVEELLDVTPKPLAYMNSFSPVCLFFKHLMRNHLKRSCSNYFSNDRGWVVIKFANLWPQIIAKAVKALESLHNDISVFPTSEIISFEDVHPSFTISKYDIVEDVNGNFGRVKWFYSEDDRFPAIMKVKLFNRYADHTRSRYLLQPQIHKIIRGTPFRECANHKCSTNSVEKWYRCEGCYLVVYCGRKCAKYHWKYYHRYICGKMAALSDRG